MKMRIEYLTADCCEECDEYEPVLQSIIKMTRKNASVEAVRLVACSKAWTCTQLCLRNKTGFVLLDINGKLK